MGKRDVVKRIIILRLSKYVATNWVAWLKNPILSRADQIPAKRHKTSPCKVRRYASVCIPLNRNFIQIRELRLKRKLLKSISLGT